MIICPKPANKALIYVSNYPCCNDRLNPSPSQEYNRPLDTFPNISKEVQPHRTLSTASSTGSQTQFMWDVYIDCNKTKCQPVIWEFAFGTSTASEQQHACTPTMLFSRSYQRCTRQVKAPHFMVHNLITKNAGLGTSGSRHASRSTFGSKIKLSHRSHIHAMVVASCGNRDPTASYA